MIELTDEQFWFLHDTMVAVADPLQPMSIDDMVAGELKVVMLLEEIASRLGAERQ